MLCVVGSQVGTQWALTGVINTSRVPLASKLFSRVGERTAVEGARQLLCIKKPHSHLANEGWDFFTSRLWNTACVCLIFLLFTWLFSTALLRSSTLLGRRNYESLTLSLNINYCQVDELIRYIHVCIWECPNQNKLCSIEFPMILPCFDLDNFSLIQNTNCSFSFFAWVYIRHFNTLATHIIIKSWK
jgi:hypothetical protein